MRDISCLVTHLAIISSLVVFVRSSDVFVNFTDPAITYTPPDDWQLCNCSVPVDAHDVLLSQTVGDSATFNFNGIPSWLSLASILLELSQSHFRIIYLLLRDSWVEFWTV